MKKLDRFILKAYIGPFFAILLVVIFILMMQTLWLYIDELVGKGLGLRVILEFMMWGACISAPLALPLSTLLASMMTLGQMGENFELTAIKSAGVSLARIMAPLMVASFAISVGAFFVGNNLVPKAYNEIYTLRDDISRTKDEIKVPTGIFYEGIDGYVLRVEEQDDKTHMMRGVMVYDHTGNKGNTAFTVSDSALLQMSPRKDYLIFTLFNGANYQEKNTIRYRDTTLDLQTLAFARQELVIPLTNYSFEKSDSNRFDDQVKCMSLAQISRQRDSLGRIFSDSKNLRFYGVASFDQFARSSQLDTAFDAASSDFFDYTLLDQWDDLQAEAAAYRGAAAGVDRLLMKVSSFHQEVYRSAFFLKHADIESLKKFAQALACFILFFIGAPLGTMIRKGGLGTSAIISVLFFVLYWVVDISGTKLARDGAIDASTGAFISAYVLAPIGMFLCWKAINDQQLLNTDSFLGWWRKQKSRVSRFFRPTRIVFMGTPEFAVESLDALVRNGYNVVGVVTVADKPSGRGLKVNESAVKKYAVEHNLPVLQPDKLKDPAFLKSLSAWKPDLFVVVAFRMLPEEVWKMPRLGTFNLHAALLPQYRGAAPINWAVINGERMTGVTTFMIDRNIDTGGIILRQECRISPDDTAGVVHDKLMPLGADLVVQTVEGIIQHNVETRVQRSFIQGSEVLRAAPKLTRELCFIDWNDTTADVYNLIRGLSPYPAAFTMLSPLSGEGGPLQLKIYGAARLEGVSAEPGTVISDGRETFAIATRDGAVSITDLQLSGKRRMDVKSFLAGFRDPESYRALPGTSAGVLADVRKV